MSYMYFKWIYSCAPWRGLYRAGAGKEAVVCGMTAGSKGLVVGSMKLPESASDTSCTLCASWLFLHFIFLSLACFKVPCLNFPHSTLGHWIRSLNSWCACSPSLEQAVWTLSSGISPLGCILSHSGKVENADLLPAMLVIPWKHKHLWELPWVHVTFSTCRPLVYGKGRQLKRHKRE